jgi:predicted Zn-dependent protease
MFPHWRISHARGLLTLERPDEAAAELALLPEAFQSTPEVLALRGAVLQAQERWAEMESVLADLVAAQPREAGWWIMWGYATRRANSVAAAQTVLREAELRHPRDATIQFNLGCYACQLDQLAEAATRIRRAVKLDESFATLVETDEDLAALRASGFSA